METYEKITLTSLNTETVSVLRQNFIIFQGKENQIGENFRRAYENNMSGRAQIQEDLPAEYVDAIFAVWGPEPLLPEPEDLPLE